MKDFAKFMSQLKETNQTLGFFCDFKKIAKNVDDIKLSLCMLNSLIGTTDLRRSVETIWKRDKKAFQVLDVLIAVRKKQKRLVTDEAGHCCLLCGMFKSVDNIVTFIEGTGLGDIFRQGKVKNLVDYVFGVETGLDTNSRKNRSGKIMQREVASLFTQANVPFREEVSSREWPEIQQALGKDKKRFDFVVTTPSKIYLIEVNFYNKGGGSKPNEVARSYSDLAPLVNNVPGYEFVWVTDGVGWESASNKLEEAYNKIPRLYNLTSLVDFINEVRE